MRKEDYQMLIGDAINRNETLVLGCNCRVRYSGRAEAVLNWGDRIVMIKSDNAVLIHQPQGNAPVNYMKPGTSHSVRTDGEHLFLVSNNQKEKLEVEISRVHFFNSHKLEDGQTISLVGTEKDMSDMIYASPEMVEEGFKAASREEQTKYGFIDVLGVDKNGVLTVIECKRYGADLSTVTQLRRYVEKIMQSKGIEKVRGIVAAPKITSNALKMLEDWGYSFKEIRPPKYMEEFDKKQKTLEGF
ncbi:endonuclease NucS [Candidatus Woesearchaeota archaeon]|nr:endonuclease NucS [Candidatus Woesearchaeota archaeon]